MTTDHIQIQKESLLTSSSKGPKCGIKTWSTVAAALLLLTAIVGAAVVGFAILNGTTESRSEALTEMYQNKTIGKIQLKWIKSSSESKLGYICRKPRLDTKEGPASLVHDAVNDKLLLSFGSTPYVVQDQPHSTIRSPKCGPGNMTLISYNMNNLSGSGIVRQNITNIPEEYFLYWCQGGSLGVDPNKRPTNLSYCVHRPRSGGTFDTDLILNEDGGSSLLAKHCNPCGMWISENEKWFCCYKGLKNRHGHGSVNIISLHNNNYYKLLRPFQPCSCQLMAIGVFGDKIGSLWLRTADRSVYLTQYDLKSIGSAAEISAQGYHKFNLPDPVALHPNVTDVVMSEKYRLFRWATNDWLVVRMMYWCFNYTPILRRHTKGCTQDRKSISFTIYNGKTGKEEAKSEEIYLDEFDPNIHPNDLELVSWSPPIAKRYGGSYDWQRLRYLNPDSQIALVKNKLYIVFQTEIPMFGFYDGQSRAVVAAFEVIVA